MHFVGLLYIMENILYLNEVAKASAVLLGESLPTVRRTVVAFSQAVQQRHTPKHWRNTVVGYSDLEEFY